MTLKRLLFKIVITVEIKIAHLCFKGFTNFYVGTQVLSYTVVTAEECIC